VTPRLRFVMLSAGLLAVAACAHDFEPPERGARVERAREQYSAALFDSLAWDGQDARSLAGNTVYAERCARCHGPLGRGDTPYARGRGLSVPSLVEADWDIGSLDDLRRALYVGHESGMPIFGEGVLTPREIDATAGYILETLRPEVLGNGGG